MNALDQSDEMDAAIAAIDLRIDKKKATIEHYRKEQDKLAKKLARHEADLRHLGQLRSEQATFKLI